MDGVTSLVEMISNRFIYIVSKVCGVSRVEHVSWASLEGRGGGGLTEHSCYEIDITNGLNFGFVRQKRKSPTFQL